MNVGHYRHRSSGALVVAQPLRETQPQDERGCVVIHNIAAKRNDAWSGDTMVATSPQAPHAPILVLADTFAKDYEPV